MKRIVCGILVGILVLSLCACERKNIEGTKKSESELRMEDTANVRESKAKKTEEVSEENVSDENEFWKKVEGIWMNKENYDQYDQFDFVQFSDNSERYGTYQGEWWNEAEKIEHISKFGEDMFQIDGGMIIVFSRSIDNKETQGASLTINDLEYIYMGKTLDEAGEKYEREYDGKSQSSIPSNPTESNYDKYKDKTVQDIRVEYGQEKESWMSDRRIALYYDDPLVPRFYYTFRYESSEAAFEALQREPVARSNALITGFAAGSKGTEVYKGIKIGDNFDEAMNVLGAITEKRDLLSATSYPHGGRIDWVLVDGIIAYASVTYGH